MNKPQLKITISLSAFHRFRLRELASPEGGDWYTPTYNLNHNVVECIHYFTLSRKSYLLFSIQVPLCQLMGTHHQLLVFVFALVCRGFQINTPNLSLDNNTSKLTLVSRNVRIRARRKDSISSVKTLEPFQLTSSNQSTVWYAALFLEDDAPEWTLKWVWQSVIDWNRFAAYL